MKEKQNVKEMGASRSLQSTLRCWSCWIFTSRAYIPIFEFTNLHFTPKRFLASDVRYTRALAADDAMVEFGVDKYMKWAFAGGREAELHLPLTSLARLHPIRLHIARLSKPS